MPAPEPITYSLHAIGHVASARTEPLDDDWDAVPTSITLHEDYSPDALAGLSDFSHIEVVFVFDRVDPATVQTAARHPRGNTDWPKVGIFAQRGKGRPNRLGVTICRLLSVDGRTIQVSGLDAIDGTPIVDIKPVMEEFTARGEIRQPQWTREIMADYWGEAGADQER